VRPAIPACKRFLPGISDEKNERRGREQRLGESPADRFIRVVSAREASIQVALGKLRPPYDLRDDLPRLMKESGLQILVIALDDATAAADLPHHHGDPFDRMLASLAMRHNLRIIRSHAVFAKYGLRRIW
jgi:PIN domain nuclease of toxin-antitoxin system